jgi:aryl-alcohol dehydrogenase-like predicted oxidoreductase
MDEIEGSLKRLDADYVDLYQLHEKDPVTPFDETLRALDDLVRQGKVRYIGCSNFTLHGLAGLRVDLDVQGPRADRNGKRPAGVQHALVRGIEQEFLPFCQQYGVGILPYYPLAEGFLTGKYRRGQSPPEGATERGKSVLTWYGKNFDILEGLEQFSGDRGHTVLELAFAWLLAKPQVSSVIAGATTAAQVEANAASGEWELSDEEYGGIRPDSGPFRFARTC